MNSYILRHWNGAISSWQSLINTLAAYVISTLVVVWIGMQSGKMGGLSLAILLLVWIPIVIWAVVGTLHSGIHALANWRTRRLEALGGGVAIAAFVAAAYFVVRDISALMA